MTKPKAKQPLESFDPRLMQLLINGARSRIVIPFIGDGMKAKAHQFQRRLHTLRSRMRQENHEHTATVSRCVTRLFWGINAVQEGLLDPIDEKDSQTAEHAKQLWKNDGAGRLGAFLVVEPTDAKFDNILKGIKVNPADGLPSPLEPHTEAEKADLEEFFSTLPGASGEDNDEVEK